MLSNQLISLTYLVLILTMSSKFWFAQILWLEYVHSHHFIHHNIKPSNFLIGISGNCDTIYIIDFSLAKQYRDKDTCAYILYSTNHTFTGTVPFASINNHHSLEQLHHNDLESLAYLLIYFLCGSLP